MATLIRAIQYRNLDEARAILRSTLIAPPESDIFDDGGEEPQGLLSVVAEDLLPEEDFHKLFDVEKGTLVEIERIEYSGFGPPAAEGDYMGFVTKKRAYVIKGRRYPIEIMNCPLKARDIHHLEALVLDSLHPFNSDDLAERLELPRNWDFDHLFDLISNGQITGEEIDKLIHLGIQ